MVHFSFFPPKRDCQAVSVSVSSTVVFRIVVSCSPSSLSVSLGASALQSKRGGNESFGQTPESPENWTHAPTLPLPREKPGAGRFPPLGSALSQWKGVR